MEYLKIEATHRIPRKETYSDDAEQPFEVYKLEILMGDKDWYITEYACAYETNWYAIKFDSDPKKDGYEKIIKINDIYPSHTNGIITLYTRKDLLDQCLNPEQFQLIIENGKKRPEL